MFKQARENDLISQTAAYMLLKLVPGVYISSLQPACTVLLPSIHTIMLLPGPAVVHNYSQGIDRNLASLEDTVLNVSI